MAGENHVRTPREQFVADTLNHTARFVGVSPTTVKNILVFEAEVAGKGNAFASQLGGINRQIEAVARHEQSTEFETGRVELRFLSGAHQGQWHIDGTWWVNAIVGQHRHQPGKWE